MSSSPSKSKKSASSKKRPHDDITPSNETTPCLELYADDAPSLNELNLGLDNFVYPLSGDAFMDDFFRNRAVCIHSRGIDRITSLIEDSFSNLDVNTLFKSTASDNVFIWLGKKKAETPKNIKKVLPPLQSIEIEDPDAATALHNAGHAAYCRAPLPLDRRFVDSFLQDTALGLG